MDSSVTLGMQLDVNVIWKGERAIIGGLFNRGFRVQAVDLLIQNSRPCGSVPGSGLEREIPHDTIRYRITAPKQGKQKNWHLN